MRVVYHSWIAVGMSRKKVKNYQPIAVMDIILKIFSRSLSNNESCERNRVMREEQNGFC